jgi:ATP-binding cassette subfamily B protein
MMVNGQCSVGSLLALVMLMGKVTSLFNQLGSFVTQFQISMAGAARVFEILDILPEPERYIGSEVKKANGLISMEEGTFRYAEGILAIDRISFHVPQGSVAAIVGPSGSGKSTVMKLLLGYYPLDSGSIFVNGKPMGNYTLTELRDMMAYVPQDAYLFDGTIEDNIRYGRIEATYEEIVSAAIAANLHEFIINQPAQYKTMVGERGLYLSGGQKQRIAIARALLKNAPILLLDEATSALDSESEQLVQEAVQTLMKGRTILMVAHRLSTIEHADVIYVMEKGKIAEWGNHQELLATKGLYNHLYKMQITYTQPNKTAI